MRAERWQQVEAIFQASLELESEERRRYLDEACGEDRELRQEVESLLAAYEKTGTLMNVPAHEMAAQLIAGGGHTALTDEQDDRPVPTGGKRIEDARFRREAKPAAKSRRRVWLGGLFFALVLTNVSALVYVNLKYLGSYDSDYEWFAQQQGGHAVVTLVDYNWTSSPLRAGDEIVAVNSKPFEDINAITQREIIPLRPGSPYTLTIRRDGQAREVTRQTLPTLLGTRFQILQTGVVFPVLFTLAGLVLFVLKPSDTRAAVLAVMFAFSPRAAFSADLPGWIVPVLSSAYLLQVVLLAPLLLHFSLVFPEQSPLLGRSPRLPYHLYLPSLLLVLPIWGTHQVLHAVAPSLAQSFYLQYQQLFAIRSWQFILYVSGAILLLVLSYRRADEAVKRKLRLILAVVVILGPPHLAWAVLHQVVGWEQIYILLSTISPDMYTWVQAGMLSVPAMVYLALAYAIIRHRVIPVSLIIRRTVQYLLAKNALRLLVALPVVGLALTVLANPERTLSEILFRNSIYFYLLLILAPALGLKFRRPLGEWLDRQFFREAYNQEQILRGLIDDLKRFDSLPNLSERVSRQVEQALHPECIYLFYREGVRRDLMLGYSSGAGVPRLRIPEEFCLLRLMERRGHAVELPLSPKVNLPYVERSWLQGLGAELIVPMIGTGGRLAGLFLLGEKKSEVPYTSRDRQLLESIAGQIAVVCENVQLRERVELDRKIKREVLARLEKQAVNLLRECPACGACYDGSAQSCAKDESELTLSLPVEQTIDDRYRLEQLIGKGGMGAVYEATDLRLHRRVAVKILGGNLFGDSEALRRFEREAQAAARLSHPHIIAVHDYGLLSTEGAYLVMELARGETLGALFKREGRIAPPQVAELFDQMLAGVAAAHEANVIHRDLKPDNILLTNGEWGRGMIKVLDFGLAKLVGREGGDLSRGPGSATAPGTVMGTFGYMAPEQLTGSRADERSDLFAIGVMVVEAVTGQRPFGGRTYHELLTSISHGGFHLPHSSSGAERLGGVLQRCLASEQDQRYPSIGELRRELIPALRAYQATGYHEPAKSVS